MYNELVDIIIKCITGQPLNRNDEAGLYYSLSRIYGEGNVLTEIAIDEGRTVYFGCAIREAGKWKVYNLAGSGVGVVVKWGKRFQLCRRLGNDK